MNAWNKLQHDCANNRRYSPALISPGRKRIGNRWETKGKAACWNRLREYLKGYAAKRRGRKGRFTVATAPTQQELADRLGFSREWINQCMMMLRNDRGMAQMAAEGIILIAGRNDRGHNRVFLVDAYHAARTKGRYIYVHTRRPSDPDYCQEKNRFKLSHSKVRLTRVIDRPFLKWLLRPAFLEINDPCEVISPPDQLLRNLYSMIRPQERPDSALSPPVAVEYPLDFDTDPRILKCQRFKERLRRSDLLFKAERGREHGSHVENANGSDPLSPQEQEQAANAAYFSDLASKLRERLRTA